MTLTAVWGSSGSGKSAVALALGAALARRKEDTLIISTDGCTPALPVYLPRNNGLAASNSIGGLLELQNLTEGSLKGRIHRHPKSDHLFFMGHVSGEIAAITYRPPERAAIVSLIHILQGTPFRHVILDCASNPVYDSLTLFALEAADTVLRVVTPDIKGCEFQKAQLAWLCNSDAFHTERHVKLCNLAFPFSPVAEAAALCGGFDFSLPYARQVAEKMVAGELLAGFNELSAIQFEDSILALAGRVREQPGK